MEKFIDTRVYKSNGFFVTNADREFDWNVALTQKDIDSVNWRNMLRLAGDWVTCACGRQCSIIPRDAYGVPKDRALKELGSRFYEEISDENKRAALNTLKKIEERSAYLIQQILNS